MSKSTTYPGADRSQDRSKFGGVTMPRLDKVLWHTTESSSWPAYTSLAPQLTVDPIKRQIRQHMPLNLSASALSNAGTYRTNRANVVQIEIVGYCADDKTSSSYHISKWGEDEYRFLGSIARWFWEEWGVVRLASGVQFVSYSDAYYDRKKQRLSVAQYDAYEGHLGHQHVPGNDHPDPGLIDIHKLLDFASTDDDDQPVKKQYPTSMPTYRVALPVVGGTVGYAYGTKDSGYSAGYHTGQDYKASSGATILAVWNGVIRRKPVDPKGYGSWFILEADNGRDYVYCHCSSIDVADGRRVIQGEPIAKVGSTGNSTGPHLHLEDRPRGGGYGNVRRPDWPSWDGRSFIEVAKLGASHPFNELLGWRLVAHLGPDIYREGPGPRLTATDVANLAKWQRSQGWIGADADGYAGPESWRRLMLPGAFETTGPVQPPTKPVVWPRVTTEPVAKSYWVDPTKVSTRLNAREADGSIVREREPGFLISTAEAVVVGGATKPAAEGATRWLRTKAGFYYALDFLTTSKPKGGDVLKIGTLNGYAGNALSSWQNYLTELAKLGADVVGCQELSDDAKQKGLTKHAKSLGWGATTRNSAVTTFYDKNTQQLLDEGYVVVDKGGKKWEPGAGGSTSIYKIIMVCKFRDKRTGRVWHHLNHHVVPTIERNGAFRSDHPIRVGIAKKQIKAVCERLKMYGSGGAFVAATADWNIARGGSASKWAEQQFHDAGARSCWEEWPDKATHTSGRTIDWVVASDTADITDVQVLARRGTGDHNPVLVTYTL